VFEHSTRFKALRVFETLRVCLGLLLCGFLLSCAVNVSAPQDVTRLRPPTEGEKATVARLVDGDTVKLADGRTVRYVGINTPERSQLFYEEAKQANRRLVEGRTVRLVLDAQPTDRFGRVLAYVWAGERFVNLELVHRGFANAYTEPPNARYSVEILAAEQEAKQAQVGLRTLAGVPVRIRNIHFNAPGDDAQNPNGEWAELVNEGSQAIDLTGFTLKDEANHVCTFPAVRLKPRQVVRVYSGQRENSSSALYWGRAGDAHGTTTATPPICAIPRAASWIGTTTNADDRPFRPAEPPGRRSP